VGMAGAAVALAAFSRNGIALPEIISQFLIGGGPLRLEVTPAPFFLALGIVALVSIFATIYPVSVATKVSPLSAMSER